ncbi:MAG: glycosyl transferase [Phenylobacterium zucineum]|nr:MAG: glycosyl transferase [Phenylobacterium zucineum]
MNGIAAQIVTDIVRDAEGSKPKVSVVMVIYKTGEAMTESLACVLADPRVDELVVVDNGSSLIEAARLRGFAETDRRVVLVNGQGNVGFARGANLGARRATGDVLIFLNPDAFLQSGCVGELLTAIEGRPVPCIVGGRIMNADGSEQRGARRGDITLISALLSLSHLARRIPAWRQYEVHWEEDLPPEGIMAIPTISGACFCMRREDFEAVQGFDEHYFLHVEDVDLCWRVRQAGGTVLFQPAAEVIHLGHTSRASSLRVEFHKGVGLARFFRKRATTGGQTLAAWLLSPLIVLTAVIRPLMRRVRGRRS